MVDNTTLPTGVGGDTIATDDIGGVKFQRIKLIHGADGVNAGDVDNNNPYPIKAMANSLVSTANSSTANLAGAAVFTGTSEDVSEYSTIMISVFSSHASATDGLSLQQSSDGTNWDLLDVYSIPAATGKSFQIPVQGKFYRLVYTNGATLTTSLRIQTIHSKAVKRGSSHRAQDARTNENDFEEVASYLLGYNGTGWDRLRSTIANGLAVDVTRHPALTKGTQGATGVTTQDLKDSGRAIVNAATAIAGVTCVTAEALLALNISRDGAATASATSHAVTAAKRWRVTGLIASVRSTGATVLSGRVVLRFNPSGAATATSPIIAIASMTQRAAALAEAGDTCVLTFPDGIEFTGANQIALSQVCSAITGVVYASLIGYEY